MEDICRHCVGNSSNGIVRAGWIRNLAQTEEREGDQMMFGTCE